MPTAPTLDRPRLHVPEQDRVSAAVPLPGGHALTLHSTYPFTNLGQLVRNLVASKTRQTSPQLGERLRASLLRPAGRQANQEHWVRGFLLVTDTASGRLVSAGVLQAAIRVDVEESDASAPLRLAATVSFSSCHIASKARALSAEESGTQLFAGSILRQLSFDCKNVFVARRRTVSLMVAANYEDDCPVELQTALGKGLVKESWRIAGWRAAPLSL